MGGLGCFIKMYSQYPFVRYQHLGDNVKRNNDSDTKTKRETVTYISPCLIYTDTKMSKATCTLPQFEIG